MTATVTIDLKSSLMLQASVPSSPLVTGSFKNIEVTLKDVESSSSGSMTSSDSRMSSGDTDNTFELRDAENFSSHVEADKTKTKRRRKNKDERCNTKALKFPPCNICCGKSSGSHFGVNSCEACKGFFRRYLAGGKQFKCLKDNKCDVTYENRSNCPSCRLQKCLDLGMSKEKSKLGRYSLAKRTETIQSMKILEDAKQLEAGQGTTEKNSNDSRQEEERSDTDVSVETFIPESLSADKDSKINDLFKETLIHDLVQAMNAFRPFGLNIVTDSDIAEAMNSHYETYELRLKIYGERKAVPKDLFEKMYREYGIDLDDRVSLLKDCLPHLEETMELYCNFAKLIPGFQSLSVKDQSELLKSSRCDFFACLGYKGFCPQRRFCIFHDMGYHMNEIIGKFNSEQFCLLLEKTYVSLWKLNLEDPERAILMAITIVFSDRCKLEGPEKVREIQDKLTVLLWKQLDRRHGKEASKVFGKITDLLLLMREGSEVYLQEYKKICNDDILVDAAPILTEFLLDD